MPTIAEVRAQYPQYSDMSDTALADALHSKFYADMPREQFNTKIGLKTTAPVGAVEDVAKSAGIGLAKGGIGLAGMPGDIRELMAKGTSMGANLLGAPLSQETVSGALKHVPMLGSPTSQQFQQGIEGVTGKFYEPQTTAGKFAQTAGEFLPAIAGGPESLVTKLATRVAIPALAVTGAQEAGGGPVAQTAAALGASALSHRFVTPRPANVNPTAQELQNLGPVQAARNPIVQGVTLDPTAVGTVADTIRADLRRARFNDRQAGGTFALIDDLRNPINGQAHTFEDLQSTRERLGEIARNFNAGQDQAAATRAIRQLDHYAENVPQSHVLSGNVARANQIMQEARANYAHGATAARVEERIRNAELQAASTHSGGNVNNATRQKLRPLLTSRTGRMGLNPDDLAAIEETVTGGTAGNALRAAGKFLGGGGGLGMLHGSGIGGAMGFVGGGPAGAAVGSIAAPLAGYVIKRAGDALTSSRASAVVQNILSRSPEAQTRAAIAARTALPAPSSATHIGLLNALLAAQKSGLLPMLSGAGTGQSRQ